jgi:hypothetical protein
MARTPNLNLRPQPHNQSLRRPMAAVILIAFGLAVCLLALSVLAGCAVGRTDTGDTVLGFNVDSAPETVTEAANAAASFLPEPWNELAKLGIGIVAGGLGVGNLASRTRRREDAAWDGARAEADEQRRREHELWDEAQRSAPRNAGGGGELASLVTALGSVITSGVARAGAADSPKGVPVSAGPGAGA